MAGKLWIDENDQLRVGRLIAAVLISVGVVGYLVACGVAQSLAMQRDHWWWQLWAYEFARDGAWFDVARTTATLVAIPGAAVALVITFARHRVSQQQVVHAIEEARRVHERELARHDATERQLEQAAAESRALEERELDRRVNEQYVQAVDQLRDGSAVARIAGMHALDLLAQKQENLRSIVVDVWCAYLRINRRSDSGEIEADEKEARATCTRLLLSHLRRDSDVGYWGDAGIRIDLAGAELARFEARKCRFPGHSDFRDVTFTETANFEESQFLGMAQFDRAKFKLGPWLADSVFKGHATFSDAAFDLEADFRRADFARGATCFGIVFSGGARFQEAEFAGYTQFSHAVFGDDAHFDDAKFSGTVSFGSVTFAGRRSFIGTVFGDGDPADLNLAPKQAASSGRSSE